MKLLLVLSFFIGGCQMFSNSGQPQPYDREGIRRVFFNRANDIKKCYDVELKKDPKLKGIVKMSFDINGAGKTDKVTFLKEVSSLKSDGMYACLEKLVTSSLFPPAPGGQFINVIYPLAFNPGKKNK